MEFLKAMNNLVTASLGAWASVAGVLVALIGFFITIRNVARSRSAAQQTEAAVQKLRADSVRMDLVSDCSTAINVMDQIKQLHRDKKWMLLPDKYSTLRRALISVKAVDSELTEEQRSTIQGSILIFVGMEKELEKALQVEGEKMDVPKFNTLISKQSDSLQEVLIAVKDRIGR